MYTEAHITVAGWLTTEPLFTVTKQGVPYCKFTIATTNNTGKDKDIIKFGCFLWQGQQYNLLKQLNLTAKDEIVVRGMFSTSIQQGQGYTTPLVNLNIYVNYIKVIRSASAERAMQQLNNAERIVEEIPVKKDFNRNKDLEVRIDKNDNPWG